ncbi:MAG TPA: hypothetical protein VLF91_05070 [Candidatus Saccharimonadales bacterium]|nr:hypothetical protein [Candidatus Saccharimonadales bacterium]
MGQTKLVAWFRTQRAAMSSIISLLLIAGLSFSPWAEHALAVTCRNTLNPSQAGTTSYVDEHGITIHYGYTYQFTVPSTSGCIDINIVNVTSNYGDNQQHCMVARVRFYPTSGPSYPNDWQSRCSVPPNGVPEAIATDVLNGTKYRVEYQMSPPLGGPSYTLRD